MRKNLKNFKTDEEYYGDKEFLSHSMLKDFARCNFLFKRKHIDEEFEREEAKYFTIGSAFDCIITEGMESFYEKFQVVKSRRQAVEGKEILTKADAAVVDGMVNEFQRQDMIQELDFNPDNCQEVIALSINGIRRKGKMDYFCKKRGLILDIKTTKSIQGFSPSDLYGTQLAYYKQLVRARYGIEAECHIWAVDKTKKFRSLYYIFPKSVMDQKEKEVNQWLKSFKKARKAKEFPTQPRSICMSCEFYASCPGAIQKEPAIVY